MRKIEIHFYLQRIIHRLVDIYVGVYKLPGYAHTYNINNYILWKENKKASKLVGIVCHRCVKSLDHVMVLEVKLPNNVMETKCKRVKIQVRFP